MTHSLHRMLAVTAMIGDFVAATTAFGQSCVPYFVGRVASQRIVAVLD
jgi:hypothetical protein